MHWRHRRRPDLSAIHPSADRHAGCGRPWIALYDTQRPVRALIWLSPNVSARIQYFHDIGARSRRFHDTRAIIRLSMTPARESMVPGL